MVEFGNFVQVRMYFVTVPVSASGRAFGGR